MNNKIETIRTLENNKNKLKNIIKKNRNNRCLIGNFLFFFILTLGLILNGLLNNLPEDYWSFLIIVFSPLSTMWLSFIYTHLNNSVILNKAELEVLYPTLKKVLDDKEIISFINEKGECLDVGSRIGNACLLLKLHDIAINRVNENLENENIEKQLNSL